jgi:RNA polymerase sigma-70 factor, ECF subfamily
VGTDTVAAAGIVPETSHCCSDSQAELVWRAKEGDEEAFAALFALHKRRVYSLCLRMTGNVVEAEDLMQDAFIQVFRKLETFRGDATFSTWLYRVVVNTVLMKLRRRHLREVSLDEPVHLESSLVPRDVGRSDLELMGTIDRIALERAIRELPKGCRTIFILHEVEGYEHHEIARLLHCSVGNSKSQLHKARLKMRELLFLNKKVASPAARSAGTPRKGRAKNLSVVIGRSPAPEGLPGMVSQNRHHIETLKSLSA